MKTVIIIPTYNEKDNVPKLVQAIQRQNAEVDILFVDDHSPDGTGAIADALSKKNPHVHVLHRPGKDGLGRAYVAGFRWALDRDYDNMMQMDADLSHDPTQIPAFLEAIKDYDAVFGSRYSKGVRVYNWSFKRLLLSKFYNEFVRFFLRMDCTDTTTAYKCFRRKVLESLDWKLLRGPRNSFLIELVFYTVKKGFKTIEIPFMFIERESGESKMSPSIGVEALLTIFRLALTRVKQTENIPTPAR